MQRVTGRQRHLLWIAPLAVAVALAAWWTFREAEGPRVVALSPVRRPMVQTIVTSGRVVQRRQSKLGAMIQGTVEQVLVDDGDRVEADALLVRLADDDALASLAEAEGFVSESEARLTRVQGVGRRMAAQALRQANIEAKQTEVEFQRQAKLAGTGAVSEISCVNKRTHDRDREPIASRL